MNSQSPRAEAALCFQCAKCSAGCPAAAQMTMLPHRAIHLIALGREAGQRHKNTVWLCAGCRTGATQCPDAVDIPGIVDLWQQLSGVPEIHIMAIEWEESVAEIVRQFGNGVGSAAA